MAITIGLVLIDQIIKFYVTNNIYNSSITIIDGMLNLTYIENTGGLYGIGNNSTLMFIIVSILIMTIIIKFIVSNKNNISIYLLISLGLILAGGIGNLIDRVFKGFVVDYIDFNPIIKYPIFNIADICVVVGCIGVAINLIINVIRERKEQ